jgi:peptide/nickel transport system ATP-binding protein
MAEVGGVLELRDLSVWFRTLHGELQAVRGATLEVGAGEIVGLVGESGSGKSVTALAVMGLLPHGTSRVTGSARVNGHELLSLTEEELSKRRGCDVGMIFQEPMTALDPVFRVGDQVAETIRAHERVTRRAALRRAEAILDQVGIPDARSRAAAYPHQLSGGMRQRVMIAISIVSRPAVLIADEPTTALDVTIQAQILELLRDLSREHGTAILLITHDLGVVAEVCARMYTMYAGEIVEACTVDEALTDPRHPYTSGLIRSIPRRDDRRSTLYSIPGRVPSLATMPAGCRFEPRCDFAIPAMCSAAQVLEPVQGRWVRCCRHDQLHLDGAIVEAPR